MLVRNLAVSAGVRNTSCIDFVLQIVFLIFKTRLQISTDLSDFDKTFVSVLKHIFHRSEPKELAIEAIKILIGLFLNEN